MSTAVYPAALRLAGLPVLVVGAGVVAQRRVAGLLEAGAHVLVVSPSATPALEALADSGEISWRRRPYEAADLDEVWYVIAAAPAEVNAVVAADARQRRIFCVRSDDAADSTAWTPAVGRHAGITVAISAGGDPRRAVDVRDGVVSELREGSLAAPRHRGRTPGVVLIGGGPGDADLITVRGRRMLAEADVVVADRLAPRALLDELAPDVEVIDASKIPYGRSMAQEEINRIIVEHAKEGKLVARLKGGDAYVFGRGFEEVIACAEAGIACTVVPGITSAVSVPALAGIPLTHRGLAQEFTVVSGHVPPGHPGSLVDWEALGRLRGTLVLLMAVERIAEITVALLDAGKDPQTPASVIQDGSMPGQRRLDCTLESLPHTVEAATVRPPAIIVIGPVADLS